MPKRVDHDPEARPIGCNGRYGSSGAEKHLYHGEPVCDDCGESRRHYQRERRRGQKYPRYLYPCGTRQAAQRHRRAGMTSKDMDLPCRLAEAAYTAESKVKRKARAKLAA